MNEYFLVLLIISTIRLTLPLLLASIGGYFSEKSGVAQIALEGFMLCGAFCAASTGYYTNSIFLSLLSAIVVTIFIAQIFVVLVLKLKVNSIIAGTGLNLLVVGIIPITSKLLFNSTGSTPSHNLSSSSVWWPSLLSIIIILFSYFLSNYSVWGLQVKFAGEKKETLASIGISSITRQWQAVSFAAALAGLGGSILSLSMSSNYSPLMSAGKGFIALAAVIFGSWTLSRIIAACFLFGFIEALQIQAQSVDWIQRLIPNIYFQLTPYVLTLVALWFFHGKARAPSELE